MSSEWVFYVFGLGLLVVSVVGFAVFFHRKGWL
jgi:Mg2+ and Co2+ transporter CorA